MSRRGGWSGWLVGMAVLLGSGAARAAMEPAAEPHVAETAETAETERTLHLRLGTDVVFGIGGQMFLGSRLHLTGYTSVWNRPRATGTVDGGVQLLYGNEPLFLAPSLDSTMVSGAGHHVQTLVSVGHTFHVGKRRRVGLGTHVWGGWNHWSSAYRVRYAEEGIEGRQAVRRNHFIGGGQFELDVRLARWVGLNFVVGAPFPTQTSYAITMLFVGLGPTFYLR